MALHSSSLPACFAACLSPPFHIKQSYWSVHWCHGNGKACSSHRRERKRWIIDKWYKLKDCILWKTPCLLQQVAYTADKVYKCNKLKVSPIADLDFIEWVKQFSVKLLAAFMAFWVASVLPTFSAEKQCRKVWEGKWKLRNQELSLITCSGWRELIPKASYFLC